jgi:phenylalanyl-tRNA synthetase beta chain
MNISYRWLRSLVPDLTDSPEEVADRLAMYGAPVDEVVSIGEPLREVVIARVVKAERHPNSDHLSLCQVDAGGAQLLSVVCGAPNVRADRFYPFAPVGSTLPGGLAIAQRKIRGELSQGMLCSARELELGRDHEGILELQGSFTPGQSFIEAVDLDDHRIVVDVTPNRPDLLSHWGVARELSPAGEAGMQLPDFSGAARVPLRVNQVGHEGTLGGITIRIENAEACPRYMAAAIKGVQIGPSPEWLAARLRAVGQRPINNVVDATNYVLQELGQPLHAFDLRKLAGSAIVIRDARAQESLVTLDGVNRALKPGMLVIADADHATAIAGVMGGRFSEVSDETVDLLIECAHFERKQIRATRRLLGMSTDASYRFERGVDLTTMERAMQRVVDLVLATAGGQSDGEVLDVLPTPLAERRLRLRLSRLSQVLGEPFEIDRVAALLEPIGFAQTGADDQAIDLRVPGHRWFDVNAEIDLVEEVARRHGYNAFPTELRPFRPSAVPDHPLSILEDQLRTRLVGLGLLEARTAGFAPEAEGDVALMLPLSSAESRLRRALLPGLLHRAEYNYTRGTRDIRLFELGTAFAGAGADTPTETTRLALILTGARAPVHWSGPAGDFDVWDLKGIGTELAALLGLELKPARGEPRLAGVASLLDAQQSFDVLRAGELVGQAGAILPASIDAPAWAAPMFGLELILPQLHDAQDVRYEALPALPAVEIDLALLVPDSVSAEQVESMLRQGGGALLEEVQTFDLYRGAGIPERTRSIAYRLRFRAPDRTLTDADVRTVVGRILKRLKDEHSIERRG